MKVNKMIYIEMEVLNEMENCCKFLKDREGKQVKLSRLIEKMWEKNKTDITSIINDTK